MWYYQGAPYTEASTEHQGFVYCITDTVNDRYYIGKKNFWSTIKRAPLKGRKNRRHQKIASDWQNYWSSSTTLKATVELLGVEHFTREILYLCKTKSEMTYLEMREQFQRDVLHDPRSYNEFIGGKIRGAVYHPRS